MTPAARAPGSDDALIERLLRVVTEGRRTATYKLALLLGIIDAVAMRPGSSVLSTRLIAERVTHLYYPQTRSFPDATGTPHQPRQISMKSAAVLTAIEGLRRVAETHRCNSLHEVMRMLPERYAATVDIVEDTFVRYPIPLMQVIGAGPVPFLYEIDWKEGTSIKALRSQGSDRLRLIDGVADRLVVLGPMLRPLIELHWTRDVARWTHLSLGEDSLREHLFGASRAAFPRGLVGRLREMQGGACFYCEEQLRASVEVDHFLAWSRWPNDAVENLVLADRCNGDKSDHLAATTHLARWRARLASQATDLATIAGECKWVSDPQRSWGLTQSTYAHVAAGTPLWIRGKDFEIADGPIDEDPRSVDYHS